jgi:predicted HicB family RNase H-like nuclease
MTILKHKDYQGSVAFEDGKLIIQILHIDDFITGECDRASEVQAAFEELIDDYLETCAAVGKEPAKPFKGSFNVRIAPSLHRQVAMSASVKHETLNSWITKAIEQRLEQETRKEALLNADILERYIERIHNVGEPARRAWVQMSNYEVAKLTSGIIETDQRSSLAYLFAHRSERAYHKGNA